VVPSLPFDVVSVLIESVVGSPAQEGNVALVPVVAPLLRDLAMWRCNVASNIVNIMCSLATHQDDTVSGSYNLFLYSHLKSLVSIPIFITVVNYIELFVLNLIRSAKPY